jgi:hypothetical protein
MVREDSEWDCGGTCGTQLLWFREFGSPPGLAGVGNEDVRAGYAALILELARIVL